MNLEPHHLVIERSLPASRDRVFAAFTESRHLLCWWRVSPEHRPSLAEVDLRVGGRYRLGVEAPDGTEYVVSGEFREIEPPRRLVYTWAWEHFDPDDPKAASSLVTIELEPIGAETTQLRLVHERLADDADARGHGEGWHGVLDALDRHLDSPTSTAPTTDSTTDRKQLAR